MRGKVAQEILLEDLRRLRELDLLPSLDCIHKSPRDESDEAGAHGCLFVARRQCDGAGGYVAVQLHGGSIGGNPQ